VNPPISEFSLLPSHQDEAALLTTIRTRAEESVGPARIIWEPPGRSAEREDLRTRLGLNRSAVDRLPSGCPRRGQVVQDGLFKQTVAGLSVGLMASWPDLAQGGTGAITLAEAIDCYRQEQARWKLQQGSKPFYAAIAGTFAAPLTTSPLANLALLAWEDGRWRFVAHPDQAVELAPLFYPQTPATCAAAVEAHLDRSPHFPRLLTAVAEEIGLPAAVLRPTKGKNVGAYALEYRSGHHLFYHR